MPESYFANAGNHSRILAAALGIDRFPMLAESCDHDAEARAVNAFSDADEHWGIYSYRVGRLELGFATTTPLKNEFAIRYAADDPKAHIISGKPTHDASYYLGSLTKPLTKLADIVEASSVHLTSALVRAVKRLRHMLAPWPTELARFNELAVAAVADGKRPASALAKGRPAWAELQDVYHAACKADVKRIESALAAAKEEKRAPILGDQNCALLCDPIDHIGALARALAGE